MHMRMYICVHIDRYELSTVLVVWSVFLLRKLFSSMFDALGQSVQSPNSDILGALWDFHLTALQFPTGSSSTNGGCHVETDGNCMKLQVYMLMCSPPRSS